ncbi:MAG: tRNA 2-thiouridine(34) synthase MnmA [Bacteroidetes bacterium]|nr:tRNA 2-thiouridine(34) synthase MnmA [Bacteroidota bacterium]
MVKNRVLMAMSGGLDSSVAAILLHRQGFEIVGITMKTWEYSQNSSAKETGCCSLDSINDARNVAVSLGFPHYVLDLRDEFNKFIVSDFVQQYLKGRTPNPCVLCNTHIKWSALLKRADELGCNYIATGHYVRLREDNGRFLLSKAVDESKDQSYVLWGLQQEQLGRTLFPLGEFTKAKIREMAKEFGFDDIAKKRESYEICFIPDDDYRGFLKEQLPDLESKVDGGNFVDVNGKVIGKHKGYPFYTVGQRKGLNIALGHPMYVKQIIAASNTIVLGEKKDVFSDRFFISGFNSIKYDKLPENGLKVLVKVRYKDSGALAEILPLKNGIVSVKMEKPVSAVTPGQSAVVFENGDMVGGGFIETELE